MGLLDGVKWGSEPPRGRVSDEERELAEALKARPGEWANLEVPNSDGLAAKIRTGKGAFAPAENGSFTAMVRNGQVYARYEDTGAAPERAPRAKPTAAPATENGVSDGQTGQPERGNAGGLGEPSALPSELGV